jgi:predicted TIM-barrel fold metal-dependent hydrolase
MKVIDPHVHLWDLEAIHLPWLAGAKVAYSGDNRLLPKRYVVADLLRDAGDIELLCTVAVEANPANALAEAWWLQSLADTATSGAHPHGIVAYADLSQPDVTQLLERLTGLSNIRGIRQILNVHADPRYDYVGRHFMGEARWRENLRWLARYGWSFDLQIYPDQVTLALEVIDAHPNTVFVINHACMFVDRNRVQGWHEWRSGLQALAARPNCAIKLSGFAMFDHSWTVESLRPYVLEAIDAFSSARSMFASNFPIDGLHSSYPALWSAYAAIVSGGSESELAGLFHANARRYYRLGVP